MTKKSIQINTISICIAHSSPIWMERTCRAPRPYEPREFIPSAPPHLVGPNPFSYLADNLKVCGNFASFPGLLIIYTYRWQESHHDFCLTNDDCLSSSHVVFQYSAVGARSFSLMFKIFEWFYLLLPFFVLQLGSMLHGVCKEYCLSIVWVDGSVKSMHLSFS